MAQQNRKKIGEQPTNKPAHTTDILHETWTTVKPFANFSIKAMKVVAHALIFVVKNIPKPEHHTAGEKKDGRVVKANS